MNREVWVERSIFALAAALFVIGHGFEDASPAGYQPVRRHDGMLRVVTWNVGGASGEFGSGLRDEHLDQVADTLRALDPDLCFLQEVGDAGQLQRLRGRLNEGWQTIIAGRGERRVAVLAQRGALHRLRLPRESRPALGVNYVSPGRPGIAAVAVHADAFVADRRNEQLGAAADALEAWVARLDLEVGLLAGDMNLDLDLGKRRDLFTDDEYRDVETYNYVSARLRDAALEGGSTAEPDRRLDYVFVSPASWPILDAGPWKGRRVGDMDHDPVVADLDLAAHEPNPD